MTPRIILVVLEGCAERDRREHNDRAWLAHTVAQLTAYAPKKAGSFTKLEKLQLKPGRSRRKNRTWEEDFALLSTWATGGKPH